MIEIPEGSIYYWMYIQGLKQVPLSDIEQACLMAGKEIRLKDRANYWNGYYRSDIYSHYPGSLLDGRGESVSKKRVPNWKDLDTHPYLNMPEIENRWVPCSNEGRPLIKWSLGCMSIEDAKGCLRSQTLAENLKGTKMIVIDCDGDHGNELDLEVIKFLYPLAKQTHTLYKPNMIKDCECSRQVPTSFHLTFAVDKVVPTMHFPKAHIDVIGNKMNSIRYLKNKQWNGLAPIPMTEEIWEHLMDYVKQKEG